MSFCEGSRLNLLRQFHATVLDIEGESNWLSTGRQNGDLLSFFSRNGTLETRFSRETCESRARGCVYCALRTQVQFLMCELS